MKDYPFENFLNIILDTNEVRHKNQKNFLNSHKSFSLLTVNYYSNEKFEMLIQ